MRILHVVDMISQEKHGGSAKVPYQLSRAQAKLGHEVTIYTTDYQAKGTKPPKGVELNLFKCWLNLLGGVRIAPGVIFADFGQFDIIHLHNYRTYVNIVASNKNTPCVLQAHGSCLPVKSLIKPVHNMIWGSLILKKARRCLADAPLEVEQYVAEGANQERITSLSVGIDLDEFRNLPERKARGNAVLFLGRMDYNKGADLLAEAVSMLPDVKLVVSSIDYGFEGEFEEYVDELGISDRVEFIGPVYGKAKLKAYVDADIYVMPSRYEMWGITFMEALACGTPVIITDQCGAAEILPLECGEVVACNPLDMAEAISRLLGQESASSYRDYRRAWVRQFSWDNIAQQSVRIYQEVLDE